MEYERQKKNNVKAQTSVSSPSPDYYYSDSYIGGDDNTKIKYIYSPKNT